MAESPYVLEGEVIMRELEQRVFSVVWEDFDTISSATTGGLGGTEAYVNGSTQSATVLSGSTVFTGNTQTLPTVTIPAGTGGVTIVIEATMNSASGQGGQDYATGIVIRVLKPGAPR